MVYLQRPCRDKNCNHMLPRRKESQWLCKCERRTETPATMGTRRWWFLAQKKVILLKSVWLERWGLEAGEEEWALLGWHLD